MVNGHDHRLLIFAWAAGVVAALLVNPSWLRWRWERDGVPRPPSSPGPQDHIPPERSGPSGPVFGQDGRWHGSGQ